MFLYADGQFDPKDPAKGLFKGAWLVRVGLALEYMQPSLTPYLRPLKPSLYHQHPQTTWGMSPKSQVLQENIVMVIDG